VTWEAWREWVLSAGVGDGLLAVVNSLEVEYFGYAFVYEWHDDAGRYVPAVSGSPSEHVEGEPAGFGAVAALRVHDRIPEIRPARCQGGLVRFGEAHRHDEEFVPDFYFESREDPPDPRTD